MLFKIPTLKTKKTILTSTVILFSALIIYFSVLAILEKDVNYLFMALPVVLGLVTVAWLLIPHLESFEIYDEKIVVKTPFGVLNQVYFDKVTEVFEVALQDGGRYSYVKCFVFSDGRKLTKGFLPLSADNTKNICVRVPITDELTKLLESKALKITQKSASSFLYGK